MKDNAYAALAGANTNIEATISGRPGESSSAAYQPRECNHVTLTAFCQRCCFDVGPEHLRGSGYGRFQGGSWAYHSPQWPVRVREFRPTQANSSSPFG